MTYDVATKFDDWRMKIAKKLSNFGLFRVQYSVFIGDITPNRMQSCKLAIEGMLKNKIPADVRFFPLCKACEGKVMRINSGTYTPGRKKTAARGMPGNIMIS